MSDSATYDNTGAQYNVSRVLTSNFTFNEEGYKEYSPLFIRYVLYFYAKRAPHCFLKV